MRALSARAHRSAETRDIWHSGTSIRQNLSSEIAATGSVKLTIREQRAHGMEAHILFPYFA